MAVLARSPLREGARDQRFDLVIGDLARRTGAGRVETRQRAGLVEYRGIRVFEERDLGRLLGDFPADNRL